MNWFISMWFVCDRFWFIGCWDRWTDLSLCGLFVVIGSGLLVAETDELMWFVCDRFWFIGCWGRWTDLSLCGLFVIGSGSLVAETDEHLMNWLLRQMNWFISMWFVCDRFWFIGCWGRWTDLSLCGLFVIGSGWSGCWDRWTDLSLCGLFVIGSGSLVAETDELIYLYVVCLL